ncbi:RNase H family protein [Brachybacterium sp. DNPG3]
MTITAAADGSALGNPGPAGWAWYIDDDTWRAGGWPHGTNNMGELKAVLDLLEATAVDADEHLKVLCDSQYVINSVTKWMPGWKRKGWRKADGKPVMNVELLKAIDAALVGRSVEFEWVKGHSGHAMNEAADRRANGAATAFSKGQDPQVGPGYRAAAPAAPAAQAATISPAAPAAPAADDGALELGDGEFLLQSPPSPLPAPGRSASSPASPAAASSSSAMSASSASSPSSASRGGAAARAAAAEPVVTALPEDDLFSLFEEETPPEPAADACSTFVVPTGPAGTRGTVEEQVVAHERALLSDAVRADPPSVAALLHPDVCEIGESGRTFDLEEILEAVAPVDGSSAAGFVAEEVAPGVVLLCYETTGPQGTVLRSSLWLRDGDRWQLRHHQGTPAARR